MLSSFQRAAIEKRILQRVDSLKKGFRQNLSVLGGEGIGKTSLLRSLYRQLGRDPQVLPVYVPCQALDYSDLAERWIAAVLSSVIPAHDQRHEPLSAHLASLETSLPKTVEKVRGLRKMIRRGETSHGSVHELFGLTGILANEMGKKVVLILDEFQALEDLPIQDPFGQLGHQIMLEKNTLYLAVSSRPARALEIFKNQLSLLFGNFETMHMSPLDAQETVCFAEDRLPGVLFSDAQRKFLVRMTGGIPLYLDLLLGHMKRTSLPSTQSSLHELPAATLSDERLFEFFEWEVFETHGRLSQLFRRRLEQSLGSFKDGALFYQALMAVSEGARKVAAIAAHMERKTIECKKILLRLVQEELLTRQNDFYVIEDPLFSFWVREVFSERGWGAEPFHDGREGFKKILRQSFERTDHEGTDTVARQVEGLFRSFRNEALQLGNKKIRLPHFDQVSIRSLGHDRTWIFSASGPAVEWYGRLSHDLIREEDVLLQKEALRRGGKTQRLCVLIALGGIDQNAKLMAQEAGIHLWLLEDLNRLFLLFNLPQLIGTRNWDGSTLGTLAQSIYPA